MLTTAFAVNQGTTQNFPSAPTRVFQAACQAGLPCELTFATPSNSYGA